MMHERIKNQMVSMTKLFKHYNLIIFMTYFVQFMQVEQTKIKTYICYSESAEPDITQNPLSA